MLVQLSACYVEIGEPAYVGEFYVPFWVSNVEDICRWVRRLPVLPGFMVSCVVTDYGLFQVVWSDEDGLKSYAGMALREIWETYRDSPFRTFGDSIA